MEVDVIHNSDSRNMEEIPDDAVALTIMDLSDKKGNDENYFSMICDILKEAVRVTVPGGKIATIFLEETFHNFLNRYLRTLDTYLFARIVLEGNYLDEKETLDGGIQENFKYLFVYRKGKKNRIDKSPADGRYITKDKWKKLVHGAWKIDPGHPTLFLENLMELYTFPDDVVLDPRMGDGGAVITAKKLGRHYIGYDQNAERISKINNQLSQTSILTNHHPTPRIKDRSPEIKKGSLSDTSGYEPDIEQLKSTAKDPDLEGHLNGLIAAKHDVLEDCENFAAYIVDELILWIRKDYFVDTVPFMELIRRYPGINIVHVIIVLGGWRNLRDNDKADIKGYFSDKGVEDLMRYTVYELKELERGRRVRTIEGWRQKRLKKDREKAARAARRKELRKGGAQSDIYKIKHLQGSNNILVIAPHGVLGDDDYTGVIAEAVSKDLGAYAMINEKYRRPKRKKSESSDPSKFILDLNLIEDAKRLRGNAEEGLNEEDFLGWIDKFTSEIEGYGNPFVFHIHGIDTNNISEVAKVAGYSGKPSDLHVVIGYGQWEDKAKEFLTAKEETIDTLIRLMAENGVNAIRAPLDPIYDKGEPKRYCGHDPERLNQYVRINNRAVQSIQLEITTSEFRDDPDAAREKGALLGKVIAGFIVKKSRDRLSFWTALSKKSVDKQINVREIDLTDKTFQSRIPDYGVNQEKFDTLVRSIQSIGIHQNVTLRKVPGKEKYQLISGFRRLSALERVFEKRGQKDSFPEAPVQARIFDSLSDEDAYEISFSENLEREDLTLWEMAHSCRTIREDLEKTGKSKGEIEGHLAKLIKRNRRTVRRYLLVSGIQNEDIRKAIHDGTLEMSTATIFGREGLTEEDRSALYKYYERKPRSSRQFERFVRHLQELKRWAGMTTEKILELPTAQGFLAIDPNALKAKVEYLKESRNKPIAQILEHDLGSLKAQAGLEPFMERVTEQSKSMEEKISQVWKTKRVGADIKIQPAKDIQDKSVEVTIAAPVDSIQAAIGLVAEELKDDFASLEKIVHDLLNDPAYKEAVKKPKAYGTMEWSAHNVNCCTGCSHDCRYCYAKSMAVRFRRLTHDQWKEERIRQEDVDKEYRLMKKQVMFPSSHDITPTNLRACRIVLGKLLQVGNRVLIVSKPHLECISKLCEDSAGYKDKILFRFSITACDDEILSFWEPHSPRYKERKEALKYAYEAGFQTSVSVEPMLDSAHIEDLVEDLSPLVTDSIWIGKMNHLGSIQKDDDAVAEAVKKIEAGQTDDKIQVIYEKYKDNPLIKWKSSIKKIVGIPLPTEPGLDI